ncbi:MAG: hypothetical protein MESAZ_01136 [Saezia sanguinis]
MLVACRVHAAQPDLAFVVFWPVQISKGQRAVIELGVRWQCLERKTAQPGVRKKPQAQAAWSPEAPRQFVEMHFPAWNFRMGVGECIDGWYGTMNQRPDQPELLCLYQDMEFVKSVAEIRDKPAQQAGVQLENGGRTDAGSTFAVCDVKLTINIGHMFFGHAGSPLGEYKEGVCL